MKIEFWGLSDTKNKFFQESEAFYENRIKHYHDFKILYHSPPKNHNKLAVDALKKAESDIFFKNLQPADYLILLDEKGKSKHSRDFAHQIQQYANRSIKKVIFLSGGAFGFSQEIYERAQEKLSLSPMTFSHQLVRTIFLEQLYRASTINKGESYHND